VEYAYPASDQEALMRSISCLLFAAAFAIGQPKTSVINVRATAQAIASEFTESGLYILNVFQSTLGDGRKGVFVSFIQCDYVGGDFNYQSCVSVDGFVESPVLDVTGFNTVTLSIPDITKLPNLARAYSYDCRSGVSCVYIETPVAPTSLNATWKAAQDPPYAVETMAGTAERVVRLFDWEQRTSINGTQRRMDARFNGAFGARTLSSFQAAMMVAQGNTLTVTITKTSKP
jgi:hypothetical protein